MNADAPLPGAPSAPAADGPLRSDAAFASDSNVGAAAMSLGLQVEGAAAFGQSLAALAAALGSAASVRRLIAERFPDMFDCPGADGLEPRLGSGDVFFTLRGRLPAGRTDELTVFLEPSQRYAELVATIALCLELDVIQVHGWPILSVDVAVSTVSEAAGVSIPGSGAANAADAGGAAR